MYSDLVKRLRTMCPEDYNNLMDFAYGAGQAMAEAADAIEKLVEVIQNHDFLESLMKPHWISVTERLPSPMRAVLVWTPYKRNIFMAYLQDNKWYVWGPDDICCHNWPEYHAITHWMELPEPPKEEDDG